MKENVTFCSDLNLVSIQCRLSVVSWAVWENLWQHYFADCTSIGSMSHGVMEFTTKLSEVSCDNPIPKSFTCIHCAFTNINGKISLSPILVE